MDNISSPFSPPLSTLTMTHFLRILGRQRLPSIEFKEPIVCSIEDAFNCFMGTNLDILAIENFILYKNKQKSDLLKDYKNKFELD